VDVFRLDATNEEIIEEMRFLADRGNGTLTAEECHSVIDFIEKASSNRRLSMRLYEPSLRKCEYAKTAGVDWQDLVRCQLEQLNHDENVPKSVPNEIECLKQAMEKFPSSVKQQEAFWRKATGKSRASFYRLKKKCVE